MLCDLNSHDLTIDVSSVKRKRGLTLVSNIRLKLRPCEKTASGVHVHSPQRTRRLPCMPVGHCDTATGRYTTLYLTFS
jgi:hypothetical protein